MTLVILISDLDDLLLGIFVCSTQQTGKTTAHHVTWIPSEVNMSVQVVRHCFSLVIVAV